MQSSSGYLVHVDGINLLDMPTEIMAHLLSFVDPYNRFPVSQSCKLLSDVIHHHVGYHEIFVSSASCSLLYESPLLKNTKILLRRDVTNRDLFLLSGVHSLVAYVNTNITDTGLQYICGVRRQTLNRCPKITYRGIIPLVKHLKCIRLSSGFNIAESDMKVLAGIPNIHLPGSKVTDDVLSVLSGVHTIVLLSCWDITDKGISALAGVHTINLAHTHMTDKGVSALVGVHTIDISHCLLVTDSSISKLDNVQKIYLSGCLGITGSCMKSLAGVETIDLSLTNATDDWIVPLAGVKNIDLSACKYITGSCMKSLSSAKIIYLCDTKATDDWLVPLSGVKAIALKGCSKITDKGIESLSLCTIYLKRGIGDECRNTLKRKGVKIVQLTRPSFLQASGLFYLQNNL